MWDPRRTPVAHRRGCTLRPCPICTRMCTCSMVMSCSQRLSHSGGHMCMRVSARCVLYYLVPTCTRRRYVAHVPTRCIAVVIATGWDAAHCTPSTPQSVVAHCGHHPHLSDDWPTPPVCVRVVLCRGRCMSTAWIRARRRTCVRRLYIPRVWVYRPVSLWVTIA